MAKSKRSEEPTSTTSKENKTIAPVAEAKKEPKTVEKTEVAKVDKNAPLVIDGNKMIWKSQTYIPEIGHVKGPVLLSDYNTFCKQVKGLTTVPTDWVSSIDEMENQKKLRQREAKQRNGFS